jgi:hypothetical protein
MTEVLEGRGTATVGETPVAERKRSGVEHFGADAVPIQPNAERERGERLRLVTTPRARRSLRPRLALLIGVVVVGALALVGGQIVGAPDGERSANRIRSAALPTSTRADSVETSHQARLGQAHPLVASRSGRKARGKQNRSGRSRRPQPERQRHHDRARRRAPDSAANSTAATEPASETTEPVPAPEPLPEPEPAPEPSSTSVPEPTPTAPAPEPTSPPEDGSTEQGQVESLFGFEQ